MMKIVVRSKAVLNISLPLPTYSPFFVFGIQRIITVQCYSEQLTCLNYILEKRREKTSYRCLFVANKIQYGGMGSFSTYSFYPTRHFQTVICFTPYNNSCLFSVCNSFKILKNAPEEFIKPKPKSIFYNRIHNFT